MKNKYFANKPDTVGALGWVRMLAGYASIASAARKLGWAYQRLQKIENYEHHLYAADAVELWEVYRPQCSLAHMVARHQAEYETNHKKR